jgi:hypothetical protein
VLQTRYEFIVRAAQPIAHASGTKGNISLAMSKKVRLPGGRTVLMPYVTGDTARHKLREAATYGTLHAAGLLDDPQLSEGASRLLFNGGSVTGKGNAAVVNLDRYRELVNLFPPLALFGGCTDNRPIPGQLKVDEGNLICAERRHLLPPWILKWCEDNGEQLDSYRDCLELATRVRMDATLDPGKVKLLSPEAQANVNARLLGSERAHETGDSKLAKETKSNMMPRQHQRIIEGSLMYFAIQCDTYSDVEFDAFNFSVGCLLNNFSVGGKSAQGHGRLEFLSGARISFAPSSGTLESVGAELAPKVGDLYRAYVVERKEALTAWLRSAVNS